MTRIALKDVPFEYTDKEVVYFCGSFNGDRHLIFRLQFGKDGSIYVQLPYFNDTKGLLSKVLLKAGEMHPTNVSLENGKTTGHRVKYSHHVDGEAHFSEDSKIYTEIRRKACPFNMMDGHLFTLMFRGHNNFKKIPDWSKVKRKKGRIHLGITLEKIDARKQLCKFLCSVKSFDELCNTYSEQYRRTGRKVSVFIDGNNYESSRKYHAIRNPNSTRKDQVLLISFETINIDGVEPWLSFAAGFDSKEIALNHEFDTEFLALNYGANLDHEKLTERLGSVDLPNRN